MLGVALLLSAWPTRLLRPLAEEGAALGRALGDARPTDGERDEWGICPLDRPASGAGSEPDAGPPSSALRPPHGESTRERPSGRRREGRSLIWYGGANGRTRTAGLRLTKELRPVPRRPAASPGQRQRQPLHVADGQAPARQQHDPRAPVRCRSTRSRRHRGAPRPNSPGGRVRAPVILVLSLSGEVLTGAALATPAAGASGHPPGATQAGSGAEDLALLLLELRVGEDALGLQDSVSFCHCATVWLVSPAAGTPAPGAGAAGGGGSTGAGTPCTAGAGGGAPAGVGAP